MPRSFFRVGCVSRGALYLFTQAGEFTSHDAATAYAKALPSLPDWKTSVVVESIPQVRRGVLYGYGQVVRDLTGRVCM